MKRLLFFLSVLLISMASFAYEPTSKWPYLMEFFTSAVVEYEDGQKKDEKVNIHLYKNKLHFLNGKMIYELADISKIKRIEMQTKDSTVFTFVDSKLVQLIHQKGDTMLVKVCKGNFDKLVSTSGAYGSSGNSSAIKDISHLDIGGISNMNHSVLRLEKNDGVSIPVSHRYFFVINGKMVKSSKRKLYKLLPNRKKKLKTFIKSNHLSMSKEEDLIKVFNFFCELSSN